MHGYYLFTRIRVVTALRSMAIAVAAVAALAVSSASAQLSGTYTVGSGGNYSTIAAAASAVSSYGVSGPVVFEIMGGTYTLTSSIYLYQATGMNATNTVTFRPQAGADVTITGSLSYSAIFTIYGGDYYIIDGNSSTSGAVTRNMTIRNNYSSSYCSAIWLRYGANDNTVRNCKLQANSYYYYSYSSGGAVVMIGGYGSSYGNCDHNTIRNNQIGDPDDNYRTPYGVAIYGSSGYESDYTSLIDNDIVNYGKGPAYYYSAYGVYIYYARNTLVKGNQIHQTHAAAVGYLYGVYVYAYNGYSRSTTIEGNRMYDFKSTGTYQYPYFIYFYGYYQPSGDVFNVRNNMFSYKENDQSYTYLYGLYTYCYGSNGTVNVENNSYYIGGNSSAYTYLHQLYYNHALHFYNNIIQSRRGGTIYGVYVYSPSTFGSDNNIFDMGSGSGKYIGYYNGTRTSLSQWRSATGGDQNSATGDPRYINASAGDLHINTMLPTPVEGRGAVRSGVDSDIDGDVRDPQFPDIGADEGNFNGGGITVVSPNGGEQLTVNYQADARIQLNRTLPLDIYLSTDNGVNWMPVASIPKDQTHAGLNTVTFVTPNVETTKALLRVVSGVNTYESDQSDNVFSLVRPRVFLDGPNGGQRWVASDTNQIRWESEFLPPNLSVTLEYSIDDGATWLPVADGLKSVNRPSTNVYDWVVPNTPSTTALVRAVIPGSDIGDTSDAVFTIIEEPSVKVLVPDGGERLIPGHKLTVSFSTVTTDNVNIDYSLDGGATWTEMAHRLPAYVGSYEWTVPQGPTGQGLVRVTNVERPRFSDVF